MNPANPTQPQTWLGQSYVVYTHQATQQNNRPSHRVIAAAWCETEVDFDEALRLHLIPLGLTLLYSQDAQPADQGLTQFTDPKDQAEAQRLTEKIGPDQTTAISYLYAVEPETATETESYLKIDTLEGIEPLDGQVGVYPRKTVPDKLYEPLFGQPEPTEEEIERYDSKENVPPMKLYAILDAAKVKTPGLRMMLRTSGLDFACLFTGQDYETLKDSAPYIVELKEDNSFTRTLFTYDPNFPEEHLSVHLWHKEPGIYIRSRASLIELGQHFTKFVRVRDESGKSFFFRFYDPKIMRELLHYLRHKPDYLQHWFTLSKAIACYDTTSGNFFQFYPDASFYQQNQAMPSIVADKVYQDIFAEIILDRDAKKIATAIQHDFGSKCVLSDDDLKTMVKKSIQQGRALGLRSELALGQYAAASCLSGQPIQKEQLQMIPDFSDETVHENKRTEQLLDVVLNQLQSTEQ